MEYSLLPTPATGTALLLRNGKPKTPKVAAADPFSIVRLLTGERVVILKSINSLLLYFSFQISFRFFTATMPAEEFDDITTGISHAKFLDHSIGAVSYTVDHVDPFDIL